MNPESDSAMESTVGRGFFGFTAAVKTAAKWLVITLAVLGFAGISDVGGALLAGWVEHIRETVPGLLGQWPAMILPLLCLGIATVFAHRFLVWLAGTHPWKLSQSLCVIALLLLGSAAAIAMSGITHQLAWLLKEPLRERRGMDRQLHEASRNVNDLLDATAAFREQHQRFPETMAELMAFDPALKGKDRVAPVAGHSSEPILYLKPSWDALAKHTQPIFVSPLLPRSEAVVIGYSDLKSKWRHLGHGVDLLEELRAYVP